MVSAGLSISALAVALLDALILALIVERARAILVQLPLGASALVAVRGRGVAGLEAMSRVGGTSAAATVARSIVAAEPDDRVVALEDAIADVRANVIGRLLWLRVLAPAASGLGLVGAAVQASWVRQPHGLLDLDPDRVLGMAMTSGALCMALGVAGSTTALSALFFLRGRAKDIAAGAARVADMARAIPTEAWTPAAR